MELGHAVTEPSTETTKLATPTRPRKATSPLRPILVLIFRLLLLGVGSAVALIIGIAIAQVVPGSVEERPVLENLLRGVARLRGAPYPEPQLEPQPGGLEPGDRAELSRPDASDRGQAPISQSEPQPEPQSDSAAEDVPERPEDRSASRPPAEGAEPGVEGAASPATPESSTGAASAEAQRVLQQQLTQLRTERQALEQAIAQLETQVGITPSSRPIDARIAALEQRLSRSGTPQTTPQSAPATPQ